MVALFVNLAVQENVVDRLVDEDVGGSGRGRGRGVGRRCQGESVIFYTNHSKHSVQQDGVKDGYTNV